MENIQGTSSGLNLRCIVTFAGKAWVIQKKKKKHSVRKVYNHTDLQ